MPCATQNKDAVQLTLEQIDVIRRLVDKYPQHLQLATSVTGESFVIFWFNLCYVLVVFDFMPFLLLFILCNYIYFFIYLWTTDGDKRVLSIWHVCVCGWSGCLYICTFAAPKGSTDFHRILFLIYLNPLYILGLYYSSLNIILFNKWLISM